MVKTDNLEEAAALSEGGVGVFAADNWEIGVSLREDSNFNISVTEVHRNSNVGVVFVVDILDLVGGPGSVNNVAVVINWGLGVHDSGIGVEGSSGRETSRAEDL